MLGSSGGSYALSKTKTDLFLRSLESYINTIVDVLNKQLVERLWQLNGLSWDVMPKLVAGDVAPHDLREIASFLRNINGAGIELQDQVEVVEDLMGIAEIEFNSGNYQNKINERKAEQQKIAAQTIDSTPQQGQ